MGKSEKILVLGEVYYLPLGKIHIVFKNYTNKYKILIVTNVIKVGQTYTKV